jgi:hypothetical protein
VNGEEMPGAYAHITIVNHAKERSAGKLSGEAAYAIGISLKYIELGAVSPDYPYLALKEGHWADNMHYTNTSTLLRRGVEIVKKLEGYERDRAVAWLFGFAGHMVADMTIHPIVEGIVGPYKGNEAAHRKCEMHQDAYIYSTMNVGDVGVTQHLETGIAACGEEGVLDQTIKNVWTEMLKSAYPEQFGTMPPKLDSWHLGFRTVLGVMGKANRLFPFARHLAASTNLTYPLHDAVDESYIANLKTPVGALHYDKIFDFACGNVLRVWQGLDRAICANDNSFLDSLEDWDLDTGRSVQSKRYVFWKKE